MRLWHQEMIPYLSKDHLLGQNRECCALRGGGWGKPHSVVDYVFSHSPRKLYDYHRLILNEMDKRWYNHAPAWDFPEFRGWIRVKVFNSETFKLELVETVRTKWTVDQVAPIIYEGNIYLEHDTDYLNECLANLKSKGFSLRKPNPFDFG